MRRSRRRTPRLRSAAPRLSPAILAHPARQQQLKLRRHASKGPPPDLFSDRRFDPVTKIEALLIREKRHQTD